MFAVIPTPGLLARVKRLGPVGGPGNRFELVAQRRFEGFTPILVGEYRLREPRRPPPG